MATTDHIALRFIQPIGRLKLPENTGDIESLGPLCYLTNDKQRISKLIEPDIVRVMGLHFRDTALSAIIYLEGDIATEHRNASQLRVDNLVWKCVVFLQALWIVKDHAIELLPAILKLSPPNEPPHYEILTFGQQNFNAAGDVEPVEFSREEIRIAAEYYQDYILKLPSQSGKPPTAVQTDFDKSSTRLLRFLRCLLHARSIEDIALTAQ